MIRNFLALVVRFYQVVISPFYMPCCRYFPSCSEYMREAISVHGAVVGVWLGIKRICRCHPFAGFGYDPVPGASDKISCKNPKCLSK